MSVVPAVAARQKARRVARIGLLALPAGLALLLACGPPDLSSGVWLSDDGTEQYVLAFEHTGGLLSGTMHHLIAGRKVHQWGFAGTRTRSGELELSWGTNNSMTVAVDLDRGEIEGTASLATGEELEARLRRLQAAEIPGFEALPELPYELRPPAPGSGWEVAAPAAVGLSPRHLERTMRAVTAGEAGLLHSLVIVRRGKLVLEEYFHGYQRGDLHEMQSVTKSVASLLVGIARDRGAIGDLDTPVLEWFPERSAAAGPGWEKVTLEHLLTMTAGLDWDPRDLQRASPSGPALFEKIFQRRVVHEPGSRWLYNSSDLELLGEVLRQTTGMKADELAAQALFAPLEITAWDWEWGKTEVARLRAPTGASKSAEEYPALSGALSLRPLDMAKVGQLVLDGGRWQGRQVVSEEWIRESTAPRVVAARQAERYGYLWGRVDAPLEAGRHPVIVAAGWGSQFIYVVPALDTVIVITGGNHFNNKAGAIGDVLIRKLVPGVEP